MTSKEHGLDSAVFQTEPATRVRRVLSLVLIVIACAIAACSYRVGLAPAVGLAQPKCSPSLANTEVAQMRGIAEQTVVLLHKARGMNNGDICTITQAQLDKSIYKAHNPKPDHPGEAVEFRRLVQQDEHGRVPVDGLSKAREHVKNLRAITALKNAAQKKNRGASVGPAVDQLIPKTTAGVAAAGVTAHAVPAGMASAYWTPIGPGNIGGRIRAMAIHPTNPSKMWVGSVSGGIWSTIDGGQSWQVVDDFMANLAISTLVIDPLDPNIMYVGTGEGVFAIDSMRGEGIFKSTDGGIRWDQLPATATGDFFWVNRLSISPADPNILLAATNTGIWRSTNAGANWSQRTTLNALDVDFHPLDGSQAIASGRDGRGYYSPDGGQTWVDAIGLPTKADGAGRVEVAYAPSDPDIVYSCVAINNGELWKSSDGGQHYGLVNTGNNLNCNWYMNVLWIDPTDAQTLVTNSGLDLGISHDGGLSFVKISEWGKAPVSVHADQHIMIAHPDYDGVNNRTVYSGNDGGIYVAPDLFLAQATYKDAELDTGWRELNNNLAITQFYSGTGNATSGLIIGGTQDNGTLRYAGDSENWDTIYGGDGGYVAIDPTDPSYLYTEYVYLEIKRSNDGGATMTEIHSGIPDAGSKANFIAPYMLDPNDSSRMLAGGASLWRTLDVKQSVPVWDEIKPLVTGESRISGIEVASGNSDIIWVGHNNGDVYKTTNGSEPSPVWTKVDDNNSVLPNRFVTDIAIDPLDHNRVYVSMGGFSTDNLWRTMDGGTSWDNVTGTDPSSLPDVPIRSVVMHPQDATRIYVGTEVGVFGSEDGGITWEASNAGPANVSVDQLFWITDRELVAATHGRGMFKTAIPGNDAAVIYNPLPESILRGASVTFGWTDASASATDYWVYAGTVLGASDIFNSNIIAPSQTSITINNLPTDGSTVHVTMWTNTTSGWKLNLYTYTAGGGIAELTLPQAGSTLMSGRHQTFVWTDVGAAQYRLTLGSSVGATDYHDATYTGTLADVADMPRSGSTLYVRLYSGADYNDYTVIAGPPPALLSPTPGSVLSGSTQTFTWTEIGGLYYFTIGSSPGASDILWTWEWNNWHTHTELPTDGRTLYVRVASYSSKVPGGWYSEYTYTAATNSAQLTSPVPGSTLASDHQTFVWTDAGATEYRLTIGSSVGASDYHDATYTTTTAGVSYLPLNGATLYVRLYTGTAYNDYTVTAQTPPQLLSPTPGSTLTAASETFTWNAVGVYYYFQIGSSPGASDILATFDTAISQTVTNLPTDGRTLYMRIGTYSPTVPWYSDYTYTASGGEPAPNIAPTADAGGPYTGVKRKALRMDAGASSDPDDGIVSYEWDFGDGTSGSGMAVSHAYRSTGNYTAKVTVTDAGGLTDSATTQVKINKK